MKPEFRAAVLLPGLQQKRYETKTAALSTGRANRVQVSTMRKLDCWVGVPVCAVLTLLRRGGGLWRWLKRSRPAPIRRILFVKLAEQGATILAYPAICRAVELVGRENVYFLVFEQNRFILDVMDVVPRDNVLTISTKTFGTAVRSTIRALMRLRKNRPEAAIDMEFFARSTAVMTYLSGAGVRVGLHRSNDGAPYRGDLMTHRLKYDPNLHTTPLFTGLVDAMNLPAGNVPAITDPHLVFLDGSPPDPKCTPDFVPSADERDRVQAVVARQAGTSDDAPLVLLNANASDLLPLRRWPSDRYVQLAKLLIEELPDVHVAFTGASDEAATAEALVEAVASERCFSMAGKTTLRELFVLYCLADVLVTNDSGPAHFATLTPINVVALFGPETPARFGSRSPRTRTIWKNLPCSPCVNAYNNRLSKCGYNECMHEITVQEVFDEVGSVLKRSRKSDGLEVSGRR